MKKKIRSAAALLMAVIIFAALCGCGSSAVQIKMATGGTAGTYYGFSGVIAQVLNEKLKDDINITVESTGASKANIQLVQNGDDSLAIVQNDVMYYAYTGTDMFTEPVKSFSAVLSCYPEIVQIVAASDISSIDQLKGKSVSVGAADSGTRYNAEQILAAYGIGFDDINVVYESFADSADSMKNGTIDACFVVAGTPTTAITELATSYKFNLLGVDDEHLAELQGEYGFYTAVTVPAETYSCMTEDVQCAAVMATIIASNDLGEEAVYSFLKGLFDYKSEISVAHNKGSELDLNTAVSGISIPFHPGALKFYAEKGIDTGM
ncbi:MAG: TAXI family TRAP transporter solute-binding subunit [Oscillospiraceae bacterium]|nr:TAXI family TRAP transporter solute-binding subunit [Oscillospiraceae bacterium]